MNGLECCKDKCTEDALKDVKAETLLLPAGTEIEESEHVHKIIDDLDKFNDYLTGLEGGLTHGASKGVAGAIASDQIDNLKRCRKRCRSLVLTYFQKKEKSELDTPTIAPMVPMKL